ncbi:MAG: type IV pilus secretin PilQ [Gammaproteobacteria bacterium]
MNRIVLLMLLAAIAFPAPALSQASSSLQSIEASGLPGDGVQVRMKLSGPPADPLSFTIDRPARISFDLPGTTNALQQRRQDVGIGPLTTITSAEAQGRTRVVFNLTEVTPYETRIEGNDIVVMLRPTATAGRATQFTSVTPREDAPRRATHEIENVDFRRGPAGEGRVVVHLSDPSVIVALREDGSRVLVDFRNASVADELIRQLDVTDFATPVESIETRRVGSSVQLTINGTGRFNQIAYQSDNLFTVELKPVTEAELAQQRRTEQEFDGERLTLNFQDIETRAVLQIIADISGLNLVVSDSVGGNLTLRLQNVPWDQALDIILRTKGLGMRQTGNVMLVAPAEEIAARERTQLQSQQDVQELAPLRSEFIQINYAKASELASLLRSEGTSLMSARGNVSIDERTNTLLVQDTDDRLEDIRRMVRLLDVPIRQVLIESRIVVANSDFTKELGARFGTTHVRRHGDSGIIGTTGSLAASDIMAASAISNVGNTGQPFPVQIPTGNPADRLNVNLPVAGAAGRAAFAILGSDYLVDLELSALQAEGRGEVVSSPRVLTANQREGSIEQGVQIPYQEASSSGATTTNFQEAVLSLRVTPQITPDNRVIMDLEVRNDTVGQQVPSATGGFVPSIDTRSIVTQVLVDDGETVVLGGIYETQRREAETKVPLLGDIPVLGMMFRTRSSITDKAELLIFVTPKIVKEGMRLN